MGTFGLTSRQIAAVGRPGLTIKTSATQDNSITRKLMPVNDENVSAAHTYREVDE